MSGWQRVVTGKACNSATVFAVAFQLRSRGSCAAGRFAPNPQELIVCDDDLKTEGYTLQLVSTVLTRLKLMYLGCSYRISVHHNRRLNQPLKVTTTKLRMHEILALRFSKPHLEAVAHDFCKFYGQYGCRRARCICACTCSAFGYAKQRGSLSEKPST